MERKDTSEHFDIEFSARPNVEETKNTLKHKVVPGAGNFEGVCLSAQPLGFRPHVINRRTSPHLNKNCPGCKYGKPDDWKCYIWFFSFHDSTLHPLCLPLGVAHAFERALKLHHSLRGLKMRFWREPACDTGKVRVGISKEIDPDWSMHQVPSLEEWASALWQKELKRVAWAADNAISMLSQAEHARLDEQASERKHAERKRSKTLYAAQRLSRALDDEPTDIGDALAKRLSELTDPTVNGQHTDAS